MISIALCFKKNLSVCVGLSDDNSETLLTNVSQVNDVTGFVRAYPPPGYTESRITIESMFFIVTVTFIKFLMSVL